MSLCIHDLQEMHDSFEVVFKPVVVAEVVEVYYNHKLICMGGHLAAKRVDVIPQVSLQVFDRYVLEQHIPQQDEEHRSSDSIPDAIVHQNIQLADVVELIRLEYIQLQFFSEVNVGHNLL